MKPARLKELVHAKERIVRGEEQPAKVWELRPDGKGGFARRSLDPKEFQQERKIEWEKSVAAIREKLGLSQTEFACLLGISVRTLHHWEQGTRRPSGAARVLLRVAAEHPEAILKAAA